MGAVNFRTEMQGLPDHPLRFTWEFASDIVFRQVNEMRVFILSVCFRRGCRSGMGKDFYSASNAV